MGRLPKGWPLAPKKFAPGSTHTPGRSCECRDREGTILYATKNRAAVYLHPDEELRGYVLVVWKSEEIRLRANEIPSRWTRGDGYVLIYLGRNHPLANKSGTQYEHRLVAMGMRRKGTPDFSCRLSSQAETRHPDAITIEEEEAA